MNFLKLIKGRRTTRAYLAKRLRSSDLKKILEAGMWGPSLANSQPFRFSVITNKPLIRNFASILERKLIKLGVVGRVVFVPATLKSLKSCSALIAIYNSGSFRSLVYKFAKYVDTSQNNIYLRLAEQAEISAASAAIQNMILLIDSLGLGSCWLHLPLFCEKEINRLLKMEGSLIAILAIGYPAEKAKRTLRIKQSQMVKYFK